VNPRFPVEFACDWRSSNSWDLINQPSELAPLWRHPSEPVLEIPGILRVALFVIFSGGGGSDGLCLVEIIPRVRMGYVRSTVHTDMGGLVTPGVLEYCM